MEMRPSKQYTDLNDEQKQSLDWTRSIAIRANAGSGKTTVLVQRIVQILHNHRDLKLDRIVAITFTRKAGAQLKEKLHGALTECATTSADDGNDRRFWQERLDELPRCPIGTIDSLCHRLLKDAIELGQIDDLDPAFGILDGIDRSELLDLAIRRTEIELKDEKSPAHEAWMNWLTTQGRWELNHGLRRLLNSYVSPQSCLSAVKSFAQSELTSICNLLRLKALVRLSSEYDQVKEGVRSALAEMQGLSAKERGYKSIVEISEQLQGLLNDTSGVTVAFLDKMRETLLTGKGDPKKDKLFADGKPKSPSLHRLTSDWQPFIKAMSFEDDPADGVDLTRQLIEIYEVAYRHFRELCREENRYDFSFLAERTVNLLDDSKRAEKLTKHYRFILVDEFQDTNEQQWRIVAGLAGVDPARPVTTDKLMIVGDPQQSIYRFRQADPTVFERIIELIRQGNEQEGRIKRPTALDQTGAKTKSTDEQREGLMRLKKNYRSHTPLPIRIIDKLSQHAFTDVDYQDRQCLEAGLDKKEEYAEVVYVLPLSSDDAEAFTDDSDVNEAAQPTDGQAVVEKLDTNQLELLADELSRVYAEHHGDADEKHRITWKDMAILLRSRATHLVNLENILRHRKIPYQLVGGLGFWQRQEVRDLVCLANCLANGADELALFAVLRGPLCGLDDSELLFLSTLGGRKLINGLQRFPLIQNGECDWSGFHIDDATVNALRTANEQIAADRKQIIQRAAERLGYEGTWRQRVDRMPHSDLLLSALDESGAWGVYTIDEGERRLANLRLFFAEVRLLESNRTASLADTARRLKKLVDESTNDEQAELTPEDNDAVQVMTVHAAKGLEFKVVAVVGLERQFRPDSESVMLLDRFQHFRKEERVGDVARNLHGLPVISFRDPQMPLQKIKPLLHQALSKIERELTVEEEARIFHVAITRAERVLILAGSAPKGDNWPRKNTWQKWVHDGLGLDRDIDEGLWHDPADRALRIRIVRQKSSEQFAVEPAKAEPMFWLESRHESPRRRTIAATLLSKMLEDYRDRPNEWAMRYQHHVQPYTGAVPKQLIDGSKPDRLQETGKLVGTLVHRALEMGEAFPKKPSDRRALLLAHAAALTNDRGADPDEPGSAAAEAGELLPVQIANTAEKILAHVLPNNPFKGLLEVEGESEVDFALPVGAWIVTGRFDRLIRQDDSWEIVDWKTDDKTAEKIVTEYGDQMRLYALALYESLPEKPREVVVHLAMTAPRESRRLVFTANELGEYRKKLENDLPAV